MSKLQEHLARVRQEADDSDLSNLAHALLQVETEAAYLQDLKGRIEALAEKPKHLRSCDAVKGLYDEAYGRGKRPRI